MQLELPWKIDPWQPGLSSWCGRVIVGYAMDRVSAPYVAAFTFVLALAGIGLVAFGTSGGTLLVAAGLVGFALGAEGDLVTFLASRYIAILSGAIPQVARGCRRPRSSRICGARESWRNNRASLYASNR